jgi:hypothetical protein
MAVPVVQEDYMEAAAAVAVILTLLQMELAVQVAKALSLLHMFLYERLYAYRNNGCNRNSHARGLRTFI